MTCRHGVSAESKCPHCSTPSRLKQFDDAIAKVTDIRGATYGHPAIDFDRVTRLKAVVAECPNLLVRHVLEMICVKIARLIETPTHLDSLIDIAGYARCGVMVTDPAELQKVAASKRVEGSSCTSTSA